VSSYFEVAEYQSRLDRATDRCRESNIDALLVTPGPDLRYLVGYHAHAMERLTCLIFSANGPHRLILPTLERETALASPISELDIELITWDETEDPYRLTASVITNAKRVAVEDRMWAIKAFHLRQNMPNADQVPAGPVLTELRMVKSAAEIVELQAAGAAIDRVHAKVPDFLRTGRTEREVAAMIADAITIEHEQADFVIVAAGPNSASPHHLPSDRVIADGDVVVVDIGGTTRSGYCSDSTRTYSMGQPCASFASDYAELLDAQLRATASVKPGVTCESIDAVARIALTAADLGDFFVHRIGHGIGLETHEEPYMVAGNTRRLQAGHAFSVEPGFYRTGIAGARIEDIVVCGTDGPIVCNDRPRELLVVETGATK
jgi:Xaa-Pro aminopeptidase